MKRSILVLFGVAFLLAICLVPSGTVRAADVKEIRIGAINSMTGFNAMMAAEKKWAYEQAAADINKKGGIMVKEFGKKLPIKLIFADDQSSPDKAASAMERLIKFDKIDLALSSVSIPTNLAAAGVCEKYKVFHLMDVGFIEQAAEQNYKWTADFFVSAPGTARTPFVIWNSLPEADKIQRPAMLMIDNQSAFMFGEAFRHWAKEHGYKFVVDEPYPEDAKDFSAQILKMKAAKVDALLMLAGPPAAITLVRQMKEQGMKLKYVHGYAGFWPQEFVQALGKDANYIIHDAFWSDKNGLPGSKELGERYKKKFSRDSVSIGQYYSGFQIMAAAIEKAGSIKSEKVRDAVFGGEFQTMNGPAKFNDKGIAVYEAYALQWWNGERMPVYPANKKVWTLKMAPTE
jgi:branched-chain amino acid transport system substrate-binding protein